jgi:hypothetical protein
MIKIISEQPKYRFEKTGCYQDYDLKTEMTLDEDINAIDAIIAFMKLLNIAGYRVSIYSLRQTIDCLKDEGYNREDERVI